MNKRLLIYGLGIWLGATLVLRVAGQYLLRPGGWIGVLLLFAISFPLMWRLTVGLCSGIGLAREEWVRGAVSLAIPTLVLDPFSSAFFPFVFPNMSSAVAGVFGGWMLWCCAGALIGAMLQSRRRT
jgi:hypothetical protein